MNSNDVGYGKPPKQAQFKPGSSGNPRGRPPKQKRSALPRQMRKDILCLMEEKVVIKTPNGQKKMTAGEYVLRTILQKAASGNPTAMRMWVDLVQNALRDRLAANGPVRLLDMMLEQENRARARLHEIGGDPDYDFREATKDIY